VFLETVRSIRNTFCVKDVHRWFHSFASAFGVFQAAERNDVESVWKDVVCPCTAFLTAIAKLLWSGLVTQDTIFALGELKMYKEIVACYDNVKM